jgi:hypothetical protein
VETFGSGFVAGVGDIEVDDVVGVADGVDVVEVEDVEGVLLLEGLGAGGGFGLVPKVEGVGDECGVLAVNVDEEDECGGVLAGAPVAGVAWVDVVTAVAVGTGINLTEQSPPGTEIQLNHNSGTVSALPVSQSDVCIFGQFQKNSKVVVLKVLTLQKLLHLRINVCKPLSLMAHRSALGL